MIECLWRPWVDALKGGFCEINAFCDASVNSVNAGEDVAGSSGVKAVSCERYLVRLMENNFCKLDAIGVVVVYPIYPGYQIVRTDRWMGICPNMTCIVFN